MYNRFTFHKNTFAVFKRADLPSGFKKPHYVSRHGSRYFFTKEGVFRYSNHWGRVGNCSWRLDNIDHKQQTNYWGYCSWEHFFDNNERMPLYFIEEQEEGLFFISHKDSNTISTPHLKTASEAAKILKKIREINSEVYWAKYLIYDDLSELRKHFIHELIHTDKSFQQIKRAFL